MNWMDMSLRDFQAALASSSPTPGGGTAAAVALGQAAALTCMVTDLTIGKEKWQEGIESKEYPADSIWTPEPKTGDDYKWVTIFNSHRNNTAHSGSKDKKVGLTKDEVDFLRKIDRAIN